MEFLATSTDIKEKTTIRQLYEKFKQLSNNQVGFCYYKYPLAGNIDNYLPSLVILDKAHGMLIFESYDDWTIDSIQEVSNDFWVVNGKQEDAPQERLIDYKVALLPRYEKFRELRDKIAYNAYIILPSITKADFEYKFPGTDTSNILFTEYLSLDYSAFWKFSKSFNDDEWIMTMNGTFLFPFLKVQTTFQIIVLLLSVSRKFLR